MCRIVSFGSSTRTFCRSVDAYAPMTAFGLPVTLAIGTSIAIELTLKPDSVSTPNGFTASFASSAAVSTGGVRRRFSVSNVPPRSM